MSYGQKEIRQEIQDMILHNARLALNVARESEYSKEIRKAINCQIEAIAAQRAGGRTKPRKTSTMLYESRSPVPRGRRSK